MLYPYNEVDIINGDDVLAEVEFNALFNAVIRRYFLPPHNDPVKSSWSKLHTIQPPNRFDWAHSTCKQIIQGSLYYER